MSLFKKNAKAEQEMEEQVQVHDVEVGTAEDVEAVMKKFDRESNTRVWEGVPKILVKCVMIAFSLYCLYMTLFSTALPEFRLSMFLAFIIVIGILNFPVKKGIMKPNHLPWYDILIMVLGAAPFIYFAVNAETILLTDYAIISKDPFMLTMAVMGILAMVELCRRSVGIPILCVAGALLIYAFCNVRFGKVMYDLFYTTSGVLGTPINTAQKYIVVFIIFGHSWSVPAFPSSSSTWLTAWLVLLPAVPQKSLSFPRHFAAWFPAPPSATPSPPAPSPSP